MSIMHFGNKSKDSSVNINGNFSENFKDKMKRDKTFLTKVIIRRLPPSMSEEQFIEQIAPLPEHDYLYFVKADMRLGAHAFSRAYINFIIPEDIFIFKDKFDGYVFLDSKGNEYPAIVEYAPFQKIPKKRNPKKKDAKCGTISTDPDYLKFVESLNNPDEPALQSAENYLEEIESRDRELKANNGCLKMTTPLIEFLKARKIEQQKIREEKREERKRKELEKKRIREEERRRRKAEKERAKEKFLKEKDSLSEKEPIEEGEETPLSESAKQVEPVVQVLKNPEREKEQIPKSKEYVVVSRSSTHKEQKGKKEWERIRPKERPKAPSTRTFYSEKDRSRREKTDYKIYSSKRTPGDSSQHKHHEEEGESKEGEEESNQSEGSSRTPPKEESKEEGACGQWSPKEKRDNSCPGNVETPGSSTQQEKREQQKGHSKSVAGDEETNDASKNDESNLGDRSKDPRTERRIRNKDRPSLEIYRPGMRRFSSQRSSPQKETSASNSSSPSPPLMAPTKEEQPPNK